MLRLLLCSFFLILGAHAECPSINDLPVMTEGGDAFYCFWNWWEEGADIPLEGCNGREWNWMDGTDSDHANECMGSIIVKAGCTMYGYEGYTYDGERIDYPGPATFPDGCSGSHCPFDVGGQHAWGFRSFKCRCQQDPIICTPSDKYITIMQCDNTKSDVETLCQYTKTIGTTYTNTAQESMSIDATIESAMEVAFFNFFKETIGISLSTGYDWTQTSSEAKSETHSFTVRTTVPAHKLLVIEGAQGDCGGNVVYTELFRITTMDGDGNVELQYIDTTAFSEENISK